MINVEEIRDELEQLILSKGWKYLIENIEEQQNEIKEAILMTDFIEEDERRMAMKRQANYNALEILKDLPHDILREIKHKIEKEGDNNNA